MSANSTTANNEPFNPPIFGPFAIVPKTDCPHVEDRDYVLPSTFQRVEHQQPPCSDCGSQQENWLCLEQNCLQIGCSRYQNRHMLKHYESTEHKICLSLSDHSFFCYECDSYIDSPHFIQINHQLAAAGS